MFEYFLNNIFRYITSLQSGQCSVKFTYFTANFVRNVSVRHSFGKILGGSHMLF